MACRQKVRGGAKAPMLAPGLRAHVDRGGLRYDRAQAAMTMPSDSRRHPVVRALETLAALTVAVPSGIARAELSGAELARVERLARLRAERG